MIAVAKARQYLEQLGLLQAAGVLESRLEAATHRQLPYAEFLVDLLGIEAAARRERYLRTRMRLAHLPFHTSASSRPSISGRSGSWPAWLSWPTPPTWSSWAPRGVERRT